MEDLVKQLEAMTPQERRRELSYFPLPDLQALARELHVSVYCQPEPDKDTLVSALNGWFNA